MRVLDIGCGMGDVTMLAADIVGPSGRVLGIDMDAQVVESARQRMVGYGCAPWVDIEQAVITDFSSPHQFDALVGRYVLLYLPDAGATLRRLLANVKPGGIVVFHDPDIFELCSSDPPCQLWDQSIQFIRDAFEGARLPLNSGRRFGSIFVRAGLPFPTVVSETPVGGGGRLLPLSLGSNYGCQRRPTAGWAWFGATVRANTTRYFRGSNGTGSRSTKCPTYSLTPVRCLDSQAVAKPGRFDTLKSKTSPHIIWARSLIFSKHC